MQAGALKTSQLPHGMPQSSRRGVGRGLAVSFSYFNNSSPGSRVPRDVRLPMPSGRIFIQSEVLEDGMPRTRGTTLWRNSTLHPYIVGALFRERAERRQSARQCSEPPLLSALLPPTR